MTNLAGKRLLLSASFPSGERGRRFEPYDVAAIVEAVTAISRAILTSGGIIVSGAHPTISPLIAAVAEELNETTVSERTKVEIYQSEYFRDRIPQQTVELSDRGFTDLRWIAAHPTGDRERSLRLLRVAMIDSGPLAAAVFIGGMEGVLSEYELLAERKPGVPLVPLKSPGGAAGRLSVNNHPISIRLAEDLESPLYPVIAHDLVAAIGDAQGQVSNEP